MFRVLCPSCKSPIVKKNGKRNGTQLYRCNSCGCQFRGKEYLSSTTVWDIYLNERQTIAQIATRCHVSKATVKRRLSDIDMSWCPPEFSGMSGVLHIDCTYFGRNNGVIVAIDSSSGLVLYMKVIGHEKVDDYQTAVDTLLQGGYHIDGIVIDGMQSLFRKFSQYKVQMCHFHMCALIRRKLTKNPKSKAATALKMIVKSLPESKEADFVAEFQKWKKEYGKFLSEKTTNPLTGGWSYTHRRLRSAAYSIDFYLPYLFTYLSVSGMPNTNNKIEGVFTPLKKSVNTHNGMIEGHRLRVITGFLMALNKVLQGK